MFGGQTLTSKHGLREVPQIFSSLIETVMSFNKKKDAVNCLKLILGDSLPFMPIPDCLNYSSTNLYL